MPSRRYLISTTLLAALALPASACVVNIDDGLEEGFGDEIGTGEGTDGVTTEAGDTSTGDGDTTTTTTGDGDGDDGDTTTTTTTTTGDGDTSTDTTTGNQGNPYDDAAAYCVEVINMYRASIDVAPLERWVEQEECSNGEAESDALTNTPHGAFGMCGESAQNECPGWPGPLTGLLDGCLAQMWAEGPGEPFEEHGHYLNMSNPSFTKVACGFYETEQGDFWAVQNFK